MSYRNLSEKIKNSQGRKFQIINGLSMVTAMTQKVFCVHLCCTTRWDRRTDGGVVGWMDGWMGGWTDGWRGGWVDGGWAGG